MTVAITAVILLSLAHTATLFALSRRTRPPAAPRPDGLFFVVMIPCLNEGVVIDRTLGRLRGVLDEQTAVLVIDDGSDDGTGDIVRAHSAADDRVWLFQRRLPEARTGKGEALNAAFRHLLRSPLLAGRSPDDVVVVVLDADGRPADRMFEDVAPYFADPRCGAVQVGVRMYNVRESLLARLQDFEFVAFTEIYQRGRQRVGSVGLGGNGQFARLSALADLGDSPWTACLTEDLDLGLRLLALGWRTNYCPTTYVAQQGVLSPTRLLRQRTRWFQGHLQCLPRIPMLMRSPIPLRATLDLVHHLLGPIVILLTSLLPLLMALWIGLLLVQADHPLADAAAVDPHLYLAAYAITFGLAPVMAFVYWWHDRSVGLVKAVAVAHVYTLYSWLWYVAGWRALGRMATGRTGWAKTARTASSEALPATEAVAA